jgi:hypothetical protein
MRIGSVDSVTATSANTATRKSVEGHECDPDAVKTMELLKEGYESRAPKCGTMIQKLSGCAQMWCPDCHTAFDWRTGQS